MTQHESSPSPFYYIELQLAQEALRIQAQRSHYFNDPVQAKVFEQYAQTPESAHVYLDELGEALEAGGMPTGEGADAVRAAEIRRQVARQSLLGYMAYTGTQRRRTNSYPFRASS